MAKGLQATMVLRLIALTVVCVLLPAGTAPLASAQPPTPPPAPPAEPVANPAPAPPPDPGLVQSAPPQVVTTPDGWTLTLAATNESQVAVPPLTTALSSREYLTAGTFSGVIEGSGSTELGGGTLEVGYQIGCGINLDKVSLSGDIGVDSLSLALDEDIGIGIGGSVEVVLLPGRVEQVRVLEKEFSGTSTRVTVKDVHIMIDGCAGQSFLRSYAILTSSTTDTDDIVAYYGVTKAV